MPAVLSTKVDEVSQTIPVVLQHYALAKQQRYTQLDQMWLVRRLIAFLYDDVR